MKMIDLKGQGKNGGRRVKPWQILLGIIALVLVPSLGNTFAGAIAVNSGQNVEFGQGKASATACDPSITITPESEYSLSNGDYYLETITISNINFADTATVTDTNCRGKVFKLQVLNSTPLLQDWIASGVKVGSVKTDATQTGTTVTNLSPASGMTVVQSGSNGTSGVLSFHITTPYLLASSVDKILIQTQ